jgi:hypothetical protein
MTFPSRRSLRYVTLGGWLMVLPGAIFLTAAVLRLLQPAEYEPARTSWAIVEWTVRSVTGAWTTVLFFGLPGLAAIAGGATLVRTWRRDERLRTDMTSAAASLWRHRVTVLLGGAVVVGLGIMVLVVGHSVAHLPR